MSSTYFSAAANPHEAPFRFSDFPLDNLELGLSLSTADLRSRALYGIPPNTIFAPLLKSSCRGSYSLTALQTPIPPSPIRPIQREAPEQCPYEGRTRINWCCVSHIGAERSEWEKAFTREEVPPFSTTFSFEGFPGTVQSLSSHTFIF